MKDEDEIRRAVERMTAHIVRALSAIPPNLTAYRAAFHSPGIESQPGTGADAIVIANLLANWSEGICLFPQSIFPPIEASPASGEHRSAVVAAAASGDRARLKEALTSVIELPDQLLSEVTYILASDYTHLIGLCGGLSAVQDVTGIVDPAAMSQAERNLVYAASLIVSAISAGPANSADYAVDRLARRAGGDHTLTRILAVLIRAAWVTIEKAPPANGLSGADDERLRVVGLAPRGESARRAVRLVRRAITSLATNDTEAGLVAHTTALANLQLPDMIIAVRYAAAITARHVPAAVHTMVGQAADRLDSDRRS